jgi:hypothetical protein
VLRHGRQGCTIPSASNFAASAGIAPFGACDFADATPEPFFSACARPAVAAVASSGRLTAGGRDKRDHLDANTHCRRHVQGSERTQGADTIVVRLRFGDVWLAEGDEVAVYDLAGNRTVPVLLLVSESVGAPACGEDGAIGPGFTDQSGTPRCHYNASLTLYMVGHEFEVVLDSSPTDAPLRRWSVTWAAGDCALPAL